MMCGFPGPGTKEGSCLKTFQLLLSNSRIKLRRIVERHLCLLCFIFHSMAAWNLVVTKDFNTQACPFLIEKDRDKNCVSQIKLNQTDGVMISNFRIFRLKNGNSDKNGKNT